jgi:hypothetical protein
VKIATTHRDQAIKAFFVMTRLIKEMITFAYEDVAAALESHTYSNGVHKILAVQLVYRSYYKFAMVSTVRL